GDDTYVFGLGDGALSGDGSSPSHWNQVNETGTNNGTDTLLFKEGIDVEDVYLWTDNGGNLLIQYSEDDFIRVNGSHSTYASRVGEYFEYVVFADETTWDLTGGLYLRNNDTGRTLYGSNYADTIIGGAGNDT